MKKNIILFFLGLSTCSLQAVDLDERKLIELATKEFQVVFDIGAHGGEWTDITLEYNPNSTLFLFEPSNYLIGCLNEKYKNNDNISINRLALSDRIGNLVLYNSGSPLAGYHFRPGCHDPKLVEEVPTITLDAFCSQNGINHIDLLKIDTEGAELDILHGASSLLSSKSIDVIQFEYGGCFLDAKTTLEEVFYFLRAYGYKICRFEGLKKIDVNKWDSRLENYNLTNYCAYNPDSPGGQTINKL